MKTTMLTMVLVFLLALVVGQGQAEPIGTAFTYQGRLIDNNDVADGLYDFQFKVYDDPCNGNQRSYDVNIAEMDVIDGYFTVELDFGEDVFNGQRRWLEIGVRPGDMNDPNIYNILSPRVELTATPYALYSLSSGTIRYGVSGVSVDIPSLSSQNVITVSFGYTFASEPIVLITGATAGGLASFLQPHAVNITNSDFDLLLSNPTSQSCSGMYNFNWAAFGNGSGLSTWYKDFDGDGFSDGTILSGQGDPPVGYYPASELIATSGDCNDTNASVYPGAEELCDGLDNDCDSVIDGMIQQCYSGPPGTEGVGQCQAGIMTCTDGVWSGCEGEVIPSEEICDSVDNDCDGVDDDEEEDLPDCNVYYLDVDSDGYGVTEDSKCLCWPYGLYNAIYGGDCDDENPNVNPGEVEICDGLDNDCDGSEDNGDINDMCPPGPHVQTTTCESGECIIILCEEGFGDLDGNFGNGCECPPDGYEENNSCATSYWLGREYDNDPDDDKVVAARISTEEDVDYYYFVAMDEDWQSPSDNFHVRIWLTSNPGGEFRFTVYKGQNCAAQVYDGNGQYSDPGQGSVDDSEYYYVKVYRAPGVEDPTCSTYQLKMNNE